MHDFTITITLHKDTGLVDYHLPADFLLGMQLLHSAMGEMLTREISQRVEPKHPGVIAQRQGMHILRG